MDKESIKKALEDNANYKYHDKLGFIDGYKCKTVLFADILTLINELEECSKKWQKLCADEVALNKPLKERIKELESENKELNNELKRYKMDWLNSEKMHLQADMEDTEFELFCANKSLNEVRAENQQLKERIAELEKETMAYGKIIQKQDTEISELITELLGKEKVEKSWNKIHDKQIKKQLKQFAERLKEHPTMKIYSLHNACEKIPKAIDETLKEFIGE